MGILIQIITEKTNYLEEITYLKSTSKNKILITRMQQRKERKIESTLNYFLSAEEIEEIETIESDISDHKPIVVSVRIKDSSSRKKKQYIYTRENIINNENINKLLKTN